MSDNSEKDFCECFNNQITSLINNLYTMTQTYRLLVGGAEEFSRIGLAHQHEKKEAIDRAEDMGDVIDKVIKKLDCIINIYLKGCSPEILCLLKQAKEQGGVPPAAEFSELVTEIEKDVE